MRTLYEDSLNQLRLDGGAAWLVRKPATILSVDAVRLGFAEMTRVLGALPTWPRTFVLDTRAVSGRNDPTFEQQIVPMTLRFAAPFARSAMLFATPTGMLQGQRFAREHAWKVEVFADEAAAIAWTRS